MVSIEARAGTPSLEYWPSSAVMLHHKYMGAPLTLSR